MRSATLHQRLWWRLLKLFGYSNVWDREHKAGRWNQPRSPKTVQYVHDLLKTGARWLEFGCGDGSLPRHFNMLTSHYTGFDISAEAIRQAKAHMPLPNTYFVQMDMRRWVAPLTQVDLIVCDECIYYLTPEEIGMFLRECWRSLKPGGHILITIHDVRKHSDSVAACSRFGLPASIEVDQSRRGHIVLTNSCRTSSSPDQPPPS
jgi:SAM-dependent methyltransferase